MVTFPSISHSPVHAGWMSSDCRRKYTIDIRFSGSLCIDEVTKIQRNTKDGIKCKYMALKGRLSSRNSSQLVMHINLNYWLRSDKHSYSCQRAWTGPIYPRLSGSHAQPMPLGVPEGAENCGNLGQWTESACPMAWWHCPGTWEWLASWHHFTGLTTENVIALGHTQLQLLCKISWPFTLGSPDWLHSWEMSYSKLSSVVC